MCSKLALLLAVLFLTTPVFAATSVSFSNAPTSVDQAQEFELDAVLTCTSCTGDSFLRGVFYPNGTSYFGYTQDTAGNWINVSGGSCTQYFKVATSDLKDGSWSGKLKVKVDAESSLFSGPGDYLFKIGRYTTSCGSPTWSSEITIAISGPTATPTPAPTSTPTPTPGSTSTPTSTPTKIPTPTKAPTSTPVKIPTATPQATISATPVVLGAIDPTATPEAMPQNKPLNPIIMSLSFVGIGLGILSLALVWQKRNAILDK